MNVPFTKQRVNESIFHASAKGYNNSVNGVERVKGGSEVRVGQKNGAPIKTGTPHAHEFVAFRLLAVELTDSNALAVSAI